MKNKSVLFLILTLVFLSVFTVSGSAADLNVRVNEKYSTGEPMLILISSDQAIDPENIEISIEKPNGAVVETTPRRQGWNSANECFETYTIDLSGNYTISVADRSTGQTATAHCLAGVFNAGSGIFMGISAAVFILSMIAWMITVRKKQS